MRWMSAGALGYGLALATAVTGVTPTAARQAGQFDGQQIFRFETFGDEQLWTRVLRMHEVLPTVPPATANKPTQQVKTMSRRSVWTRR